MSNPTEGAIDEVTTDEVVDGQVVTDVAIVPYTQEVITLRDATDEQLAQVLDECREWERTTLAAFKREVTQEVLDRMDSGAEWTIHAEGYKLTGDSPSRTEFDVGEVKRVLKELVDAEVITQDAADKAIRIPKPKEEVAAAGIKALRRIGGRVKEALDAIERPSTKPRSVRIEKVGGR